MNSSNLFHLATSSLSRRSNISLLAWLPPPHPNSLSRSRPNWLVEHSRHSMPFILSLPQLLDSSRPLSHRYWPPQYVPLFSSHLYETNISLGGIQWFHHQPLAAPAIPGNTSSGTPCNRGLYSQEPWLQAPCSNLPGRWPRRSSQGFCVISYHP